MHENTYIYFRPYCKINRATYKKETRKHSDPLSSVFSDRNLEGMFSLICSQTGNTAHQPDSVKG